MTCTLSRSLRFSISQHHWHVLPSSVFCNIRMLLYSSRASWSETYTLFLLTMLHYFPNLILLSFVLSNSNGPYSNSNNADKKFMVRRMKTEFVKKSMRGFWKTTWSCSILWLQTMSQTKFNQAFIKLFLLRNKSNLLSKLVPSSTLSHLTWASTFSGGRTGGRNVIGWGSLMLPAQFLPSKLRGPLLSILRVCHNHFS